MDINLTSPELLDKLGLLSDDNKPAVVKKFEFETLDWITDYRDPKRFVQTRPEDIYALFNEISEQKNVSDIMIMPDLPVLINIRRRGLVAITYRELKKEEVADIIKVITFDPNAVSSVLEGQPQSGTARVLNGIPVDLHNKEEYHELEEMTKSRYRYELVGAKSLLNEDSFSMVLRPLPNKPKTWQELNIPKTFIDSFIIKDGLAIIAGATGEGKTTVLSTIIRYILEGDTIIKGMIVSHEDPIEIVYDKITSKHSFVIQSAIGKHIKSFSLANRAAVRRQPALLMVGELRDEDTIDKSLELGKAGSPVFATTHANNVAAILPRLLSVFPPNTHASKCASIIDTVRVFASQKLIWRTDNTMMAVRECLTITPALKKYLLSFCHDPQLVAAKIEGIMQQGLFGAESYESQGRRLLKEGVIDEKSYRHLVADDAVLSEEDRLILDQIGVQYA